MTRRQLEMTVAQRERITFVLEQVAEQMGGPDARANAMVAFNAPGREPLILYVMSDEAHDAALAKAREQENDEQP